MGLDKKDCIEDQALALNSSGTWANSTIGQICFSQGYLCFRLETNAILLVSTKVERCGTREINENVLSMRYTALNQCVMNVKRAIFLALCSHLERVMLEAKN